MMPRYVSVCAMLLCLAGAIMAEAPTVSAKAEYEQKNWKTYPVESAAAIPGRSDALNEWGGWKEKKIAEGTGFFHTAKAGGRWWLVDPAGHAFYSAGVNSVRPGLSKFTRRQCEKRFGSLEKWAAQATADLRALGYNTAGSWSNLEILLTAATPPLAYCSMGTEVIGGKAPTGFLQGFARARNLGGMGYGHWKYPGDCIPVFHPDFPAFCENAAAGLAVRAKDPRLLGYFTDNELNLPVLRNYLEIDPADAGMAVCREEAWTWWKARKGESANVGDVTAEDEEAWVEHVFTHYFRTVCAAIRRHDPNHLILGSRFHGKLTRNPGAFRAAAAAGVDVISVNLYKVWRPEAERFATWAQWADKPVLVTEWYAKAEDSGFSNRKGAGWLVRTQEDRARFYETFVLGLLRQPNGVGFHWFRYTDDDPPENGDLTGGELSNKGIYNNFFQPYAPLAETMSAVNHRIYELITALSEKSLSTPPEEKPAGLEVGPDTN
jgi:hypothetical protein